MAISFSSYAQILSTKELRDTLNYLKARRRSEEIADKAGVPQAATVLAELDEQITVIENTLQARK